MFVDVNRSLNYSRQETVFNTVFLFLQHVQPYRKSQWYHSHYSFWDLLTIIPTSCAIYKNPSIKSVTDKKKSVSLNTCHYKISGGGQTSLDKESANQNMASNFYNE